jgi:hypothetical protein
VVARSRSYGISQKTHKRIAQGIGRIRTIGGPRKLPMVRIAAVRGWMTWTFAAHNLIRLDGIGEWRESPPT